MRTTLVSLIVLAALPATAGALSPPPQPVSPDAQAVNRLETQLVRVGGFVSALTDCRPDACFARRGANLRKVANGALAKTAGLESIATVSCVRRAIRFERHWIVTTVKLGLAAGYRRDPKTGTAVVDLREVNRYLRFAGQAAMNAQRVIAPCPQAKALGTVR